MDEDAFRPDTLGSHAFSKFDSHRAVLFGGSGSALVYSNTCYIFDFDSRVRHPRKSFIVLGLATNTLIEKLVHTILLKVLLIIIIFHARNGVVHTSQTTQRSRGR